MRFGVEHSQFSDSTSDWIAVINRILPHAIRGTFDHTATTVETLARIAASITRIDRRRTLDVVRASGNRKLLGDSIRTAWNWHTFASRSRRFQEPCRIEQGIEATFEVAGALELVASFALNLAGCSDHLITRASTQGSMSKRNRSQSSAISRITFTVRDIANPFNMLSIQLIICITALANKMASLDLVATHNPIMISVVTPVAVERNVISEALSVIAIGTRDGTMGNGGKPTIARFAIGIPIAITSTSGKARGLKASTIRMIIPHVEIVTLLAMEMACSSGFVAIRVHETRTIIRSEIPQVSINCFAAMRSI